MVDGRIEAPKYLNILITYQKILLKIVNVHKCLHTRSSFAGCGCESCLKAHQEVRMQTREVKKERKEKTYMS